MPVNGIIGYDLFKDFVVEINYKSQYIRLYKPNKFKPKTSKKWTTLPLEIRKKKAYLDVNVTINEKDNPVKLLIDTGSSDALWIFKNKARALLPNKDLVFNDYLGKGLSGVIYGERSKATSLKLGNYKMANVNVAFPDSVSLDVSKIYKERNGSLGGEVLKRFNLFLDYPNQKLHLRKNHLFKNPFTYNNSGIIVEYNGVTFVRENISVPSYSGSNSTGGNRP